MTEPLAPVFKRLDPTLAVRRNKKIDLMIGAERDTRRRRMKAMKRRMGVMAANMGIKSCGYCGAS